MSNIIVLGAGMVGSAIAIDLSKKHNVSIADINNLSLQKLKSFSSQISTKLVDINNKAELKKNIRNFDCVVCAVPGFMGFETLKTILESKKNVVDISFFQENSLDLDKLAKKNRLTAIVDCGVAPGMGNFILGYYDKQMKLTDFECLVGGLPKVKKWPFNYKAPFSPIDVIEEYTRPARYVENGNIITKPAMSDVEHEFFENIGTLESFNSDGLRSIIFTMPHIKNMKEKTLRYPGHIDKIIALRDAGFFDTKELVINETKITPIEFTSKILFKEWKLEEKEEELTVMRITLKDKKTKIVYSLFDEYDKKNNITSMARTTGYTATAAVNLIDKKIFSEHGIFPPELVGKHKKCFEFVLNYLKARNVIYKKEIVNY